MGNFVVRLSFIRYGEIRNKALRKLGITGSVGGSSDIACGGLAIYVTNKMVQAMLVKNVI